MQRIEGMLTLTPIEGQEGAYEIAELYFQYKVGRRAGAEQMAACTAHAGCRQQVQLNPSPHVPQPAMLQVPPRLSCPAVPCRRASPSTGSTAPSMPAAPRPASRRLAPGCSSTQTSGGEGAGARAVPCVAHAGIAPHCSKPRPGQRRVQQGGSDMRIDVVHCCCLHPALQRARSKPQRLQQVQALHTGGLHVSSAASWPPPAAGAAAGAWAGKRGGRRRRGRGRRRRRSGGGGSSAAC